MGNHLIACFSGSGNSYYVANQLAEKMGEAKVLLIPQILEDPSLLEDFSTLGIVFPTYAMGLPFQVIQFIKSVLGDCDLKNLEYLYLITTCSKKPSFSLKVAEKLLSKVGCAPSYSNFVLMPGTNVIAKPIPSEQELDRIFEQADSAIDAIASQLLKGDLKLLGWKPFLNPYIGLFQKRNSLQNTSSNFFVTEACDGCQVCYKACPSNAIEIVNGKAVFKQKGCQGCFGCYHMCPAHAIMIKDGPRKGLYTWYSNKKSDFHPQYR